MSPLFHSPHWRDESLRDRTEQWRDQRKKYSTWQIAIWGDEGSEVIGLVYGGVSTRYAFYLKDVIDNPRTKEGIHFDAGTSCRELFIESDEWERVLNEFDILPRDSNVLNEETTTGKTDS